MTRLVKAEIWSISIPMKWATAAACINTLFPSCHYRHFDLQVNIFLECYLSHLFDDSPPVKWSAR